MPASSPPASGLWNCGNINFWSLNHLVYILLYNPRRLIQLVSTFIQLKSSTQSQSCPQVWEPRTRLAGEAQYTPFGCLPLRYLHKGVHVWQHSEPRTKCRQTPQLTPGSSYGCLESSAVHLEMRVPKASVPPTLTEWAWGREGRRAGWRENHSPHNTVCSSVLHLLTRLARNYSR